MGSELFKPNGNSDTSNQHAQISQLEASSVFKCLQLNFKEYIEMLYEDSDKLKASSLILNLCMKATNLRTISENGKNMCRVYHAI